MNSEKIIELSLDDIEKCYSLWDIRGKEDRLHREMLDGKRKMFIYIKNGMSIGGASLVFDNGDTNRTIPFRRAYLSYLVIREEFRNQGIGTKLIDYICEYAHQLGISQITLNVESNNPRAKKLYLKEGFNEVVLENSDMILLLKRL